MPDKGVIDNRKACQAIMASVSKTVEKARKALPEGIDDAVVGTRSVLDQMSAQVVAELDHLGWHAKHETQP